MVAGGSSRVAAGRKEEEKILVLGPKKCSKGRVEEWECVSCRTLPGSSREVLLGQEFFLLSGGKERESVYSYRACCIDSFLLLSFIHKINIVLIRCIVPFLA